MAERDRARAQRGWARGLALWAVAALMAVLAAPMAEASSNAHATDWTPSPVAGVDGASVTGEPSGPAGSASWSTTVLPGTGPFGGLAVDPARGHVFVSRGDAIGVFDLEGQLLHTIPAQAGAGPMVVLGDRLYVSQANAGAVSSVDLVTLEDDGVLVDGLIVPRSIDTDGTYLYVAVGECGQWKGAVARIDPSTGAVVTMSTYFESGYCPTLVASRAEPGIVFTADLGLSPFTLARWDLRGATPVLQASQRTSGSNLGEFALSPDGSRLYTASGSPYRLLQWRTDTLADTGVQFPTAPYPRAVATSPMRGGMVATGGNGVYDADLWLFSTTYPYSELARVDFGGSSNTVPAGGLAFSPDGRRVYAVTLGTDGTGPVLNVVRPFGLEYGGFRPVPPTRILDTRSDDGRSRPLGPSESRRLQVSGRGGLPPTGVAAVVLNVTVDGPTSSGFLTVSPSQAARPSVSNLNFVPGQTVPNLVTVPVGPDGAVDLFNSAGSSQVVVDVAGWYDDDGLGAPFIPVTPVRALDTRLGAGGAFGTGESRTLVLGSALGSGATAVALNVTVTEATDSGFLTTWPGGLSRPVASNLNFVAGDTRPNMVIVPVGPGGSVQIYNSRGLSHVVVDVAGWFGEPGGQGLHFVPVAPTRLFDSRQGMGSLGPAQEGRLAVGSVLAGSARAAVLNVTNVNSTAPGFLTVYPTPVGAPNPPTASNLNWRPGQINPNLVMSPFGDGGKVSFYNGLGSTDVVVDIFGFFA